MKRALLVTGVLGVLVAVFAASEWRCGKRYQVDVRVSATGDRLSPYAISGEIVGCGVRRLEGRSSFGMVLSQGNGPVLARTTHGGVTISIEAGVTADGGAIWYVATVTRGQETLQRESARLPVPRAT